jgi:prophage regulatory protein
MEQFYTIKELTSTAKKRGLLPVSMATWWRWVRDGKAPKPVRLGEHSVAWAQSDISKWIDERKADNYEPDDICNKKSG